MSDTPGRSLVKTVSWRVTGSFSTFLISYLILGSFAAASSIAVIQMVANTVLYYFHERIWDKITFGRD